VAVHADLGAAGRDEAAERRLVDGAGTGGEERQRPLEDGRDGVGEEQVDAAALDPGQRGAVTDVDAAVTRAPGGDGVGNEGDATPARLEDLTPGNGAGVMFRTCSQPTGTTKGTADVNGLPIQVAAGTMVSPASKMPLSLASWKAQSAAWAGGAP
jgi:hypothetical protein